MKQKEFRFIIFIIAFGSAMPWINTDQYAHVNSSQVPKPNYSAGKDTQGYQRGGGRKKQREKCLNRASAALMNDDDNDDLDFFKECIVSSYKFTKTEKVDSWSSLPDFDGIIGTDYFNKAAKRVELFFIRNNDWSHTLVNPKFRNPNTGKCTNLLYIIAARHLYVIYVLNLLRDELTFEPCHNLNVPSTGVCFLLPADPVTCTSDFDIALLGSRSGSLTALFNQFFREPLGIDQLVAGFGKSPEEVFDTNVHAFTLEYAMPAVFGGLTKDFKDEVVRMNGYIKFRVQEVVSAILKMNSYNSKYFNDLMSDQVELRSRRTRNNLGSVFHDWTVQFKGFNDAVASLKSSNQYNTILGFRRKHTIAYQMILGIIEASGVPSITGKALAQNAIALMFASEAYHTRGSIRHVVGSLQMKQHSKLKITVDNYWVSMLENWADSVKEYNRQCKGINHRACLPKISKYLYRMLDAMYAIRSKLPKKLRINLMEVDTPSKNGIRAIVRHWFVNIKRKGLETIPGNDRKLNPPFSNLDIFLKTFRCPSYKPHQRLSKTCMNGIQTEIRKYNRRLFIHLVDNDSADYRDEL